MLRILRQYYPIRNAFFVFGEGFVIFLSVILAGVICDSVLDTWIYLEAAIIALVCQMCLYYNDSYDFSVVDLFSKMTKRVFQSLAVAVVVLAAIILSLEKLSDAVFLSGIVIMTIFITSWRFFYIEILNRGWFNQKIILLGSADLARAIYSEIIERKDCGYVIECVALEAPDAGDFVDETKTRVVCKPEHEGLCEIARELGVHQIVVALKEQRGNFPTVELLKCRVDGISIMRGNSFYEMLSGKLNVEQINPAWLIYSYGFKNSPLISILKRISDIIISISMLILLAPVFIITAIIIKLESKGPVIFSQERVGQNRKPYMVHKFRSMVNDAEEKSGPVWAKKNDTRVTGIGKFIRKWRVDELPQIWNVLKGEMSFVGPRPEREFFVNGLEYIIPYYQERFSIKPGLTGWAQVNYPYGASVQDATEKLNYDLFYMKNMSLLLDFVVIFRTVKTVLFGQGAR